MTLPSDALASTLLPQIPGLDLERVIIDSETITLTLRSTAAETACPLCGGVTGSVHSHYRRTLADLPWADHAIKIELVVRRFRCADADCPRRVFTERLPRLVAPYARRTVRQAERLRMLGLALGGEPGARAASRLRLPASPATLLRQVRRAEATPSPDPKVIGVDDFALRRRARYGTLIIDLERHRPLDMLADRTAATLAAWLSQRPTVAVVARDGSLEYASGITAGAPGAAQVADRWHLLRNLREAAELELDQCSLRLLRSPSGGPAVPATDDAKDSPASAPGSTPIYPSSPSGQRAEAKRQARRRQRLEQYTRMIALRAEGLSASVIARRVGIGRRTVFHWLARDGFPERRPRSGETSSLDPHAAYLLERWEAGCHNAAHLWREIRARGFPGSYGPVAQFLAPLRKGKAVRLPAGLRSPAPAVPSPDRWTARELSYVLLRPPDDRSGDERLALAQARQQDERLAAIVSLTEDFARMVRGRTPESLDDWLVAVQLSPLPELKRFASGVRRDYAAVKAALTSDWSNGPTEGFVNKVKVIKRQMYGRAKIDLLRKRVLLAA
jgi:transposase